jgi:hypothetical protein
VIWIAADACRERNYGPKHFEAIVFHELQHAGVDDEGNPVVVAHDFAGFLSELDEYGLWETDLERAADAFIQAEMFTP